MAERERLKFLVDVGVSKKVEHLLKNQGYDVKCIRDLDLRMPDIEVLKIAASESRMVITMDKDFGELVYHSGFSHAGILLLRLEDAGSEEKVRVIKNILKYHSNKILNKFCVYQEGRLRIRK